MFHGKVFILHPFGGFLRLQQRLFHIVGNVDLAGFPSGTGNTGDPVQVFLQPGNKGRYGNPASGKQLGNQLVLILSQGEHQVFLLHLHMLIFNGKRLGPLERGNGLLRKLIHVHKDPSFLKAL